MTGNDSTKATTIFCKHGYHIIHRLLGVFGTCDDADKNLERIIKYKLITNKNQIDNPLIILILGSRHLILNYRE